MKSCVPKIAKMLNAVARNPSLSGIKTCLYGVHAIVEAPHTMSADGIAHLLKGYSAWKLFHVKEKFLLRYPRRHFWSRGYMARTVGLDEEQAIKYVQNQI